MGRHELDVINIGESLTECDIEYLRLSDARDIKLRRQNLQDLFTLQNVILVQEDNVLSVDEVLTRVLEFYRRFVPFR
jgi:hypothetical protein